MKFITSVLLLSFVLACFSLKIRQTSPHNTNPIFLNETFYSGYLPIDNKGELFYWWFESRGDPSTDPLLFWLTGGPGCSSELGLFMENGPFKVNDSLDLVINPYSWNNIANVVYLDQPLGTGFSWGTQLDTNESEIASDFYTFLTEFIQLYPQFVGRDIWISGESYAGHYIPAISAYLVQQKNSNSNINYQGSLIGNGWVNPYYQYPAYNYYVLYMNLINQTYFNKLSIEFTLCQQLIKYSPSWKPTLLECSDAYDEILDVLPADFNVYNIYATCVGPLCYNLTNIQDFLERSDVLEAIGATVRWEPCNNTVYNRLNDDETLSQADNVAYLLENDVPVLIYSGDLDFQCNWLGGQNWTNHLEWSGQSGFQNSSFNQLETYGEFKNFDTFTFYRVYNAGHMVPMDQPVAALDMLTRFIGNGGSLLDYESEY